MGASLSPVTGQTLYWDSAAGTPGVGGSGTWENGGAANWNSSADGSGAASAWNNANFNTADFRGTAGTVAVSGAIRASQLLFNAGGYSLGSSGTTITLGRNSGTTSPYTVLNYQSGSGTNMVLSDIVVDDTAVATGSPATITYNFNNISSGTLNLKGNIILDYSSTVPTGFKLFTFTTNNASATTIVDGNISTGSNGGPANALSLSFGNATGGASGNGTIIVNGNNSGAARSTIVAGGTVLLGHNNALGGGSVNMGTSGTSAATPIILLTNGAVTIGNNISLGSTAAQSTIGGRTANDSTYSGSLNLNGNANTPAPILTAAQGGRVNFSGALTVSTVGLIRGVTIAGDGVVAFTAANGNTYTGQTQVTSGTLLIANGATGSATGSGVVSVSSGARLAGTGASSGLVTALAADSKFSPGDLTKEGVSSFGTLRLNGGLTAASGATFEMQVGTSADLVNFGAGSVDMDGTITISLSALGSVVTGSPYTLFTGTGDWSASAPLFSFVTPSGYVLDTTYGGGAGYVFDAASINRTLTVQLAAIPEPGTWALVVGGLIFFVVLRRKKLFSL